MKQILFAVLFLLSFVVQPANAQAAPSRNIITFAAGVYYMDTIRVLAGDVWKPTVAGARVILTRGDGLAPQIDIEDGGEMSGLWIGGKRGALTAIHPRHNATIDGNVFYGYAEGINVADAVNVHITNNKFINDGTGLYSHPVYINNFNAGAGEGTTIEDNLFVGGEGYAIHLYHSPNYNSVQRNFCGGGLRCIAVTGHFNVVKDNIFWSNTTFANIYIDPDNEDFGSGNLEFTHNLVGWKTKADWLIPIPNSLIDANWFVLPSPQIFGTNPITKSQAQIKPFVGNYSVAQIDSAIASLKTKFSTLTPAQLLGNTTITPNFNILKNAVTAWAAQ